MNLLWSVRLIAALGLCSLSLTGEIGMFYVTLGWVTWLVSFAADAHPEAQRMLRRFETAAVVCLVLFTLFDFWILKSSIFLCVAHFLILFQAFKVIGEKTRKDCLQILLVGFFQILASCTLSVDASHGIILFLLIPIAASALFWHQVAREEENSQERLPAPVRLRYRRMAAWICLGALPMVMSFTVIIFVLFPRLTWNVSLPGFVGHQSGYTDQINLGQTGVVRMENKTVLWLGISDPEERRRWPGYLRGTTIDTFDGKQWIARHAGSVRTLRPDGNGVFSIRRPGHETGIIQQTVTLLNTAASTLFVSGDPLQVIAPLPALQLDASGSLRWSANWQRPLKYIVIADISTLVGSPVPKVGAEQDLAAYLQLPHIPLGRTAALAKRIAGRQRPYAQAVAIQHYLRTHYTYTNDMGPDATDNPVDNFLFARRRGACGHFASAMALMLRLRGIPCRIAAGYYKGEWNDPAQQYLIRERDAHAWVEAYFPEHGWVSFDPTPRPSGSSVQYNVWHLIQQEWDYFSFKWNKWIVEYDVHTQVRGIERVRDSSDRLSGWAEQWWRTHRGWLRMPWQRLHGIRDFNWSKWFGIVLGGMIGLIVSSLWRFRRGKNRAADPVVRQYQQFLERMAKAGLPKHGFETGWEFAWRIEKQRPAQQALIRDVTEGYYRNRFGRKLI